MTTRITLERTRYREKARSSGDSTTEEGTSSKDPPSSPPSELLSQVSINSSEEEEEESWDNLEKEDLEQLRPPPAPEPEQRRTSDRGRRSHHEAHQRHQHSSHHSSRRRPTSEYSGSVDYDEEGYGPRGQAPPGPGWTFVPHSPPPPPGYPHSPHQHYPPQGMPPQPPSQLVPYQHHDPYSPYYQANPLTSPYGQPNPFAQGYFPPPDPYRHAPPHHAMGMVPYQQPYYPAPYAQPPAPPPSALQSPPPMDSAAEDKFNKLHEMLMLQEQQRKAKEEADLKAAEAKAAQEAVEKMKNEAVADATKKAKEAAESDAKDKAKKAQEKHEEAMKKSKEAEEAATKAQKEAEEEAAKLKPADDDTKLPIKFKDAVGRKFSFPWRHSKTWKGMDDLIQQAFLHVDNIGHHVQEGHYDLVGPDGEIILPRVWESVVKPDWCITMHMWPMAKEREPKDEPGPPAPPPIIAMPSGNGPRRSKGIFGSSKHKSSKRRPASMVGAMPGAPEPPGVVAADPNVASSGPIVEFVPQEGSRGSKKGDRRSQSVSPWVAWTSGGVVRKKER